MELMKLQTNFDRYAKNTERPWLFKGYPRVKTKTLNPLIDNKVIGLFYDNKLHNTLLRTQRNK